MDLEESSVWQFTQKVQDSTTLAAGTCMEPFAKLVLAVEVNASFVIKLLHVIITIHI